MKTIKIIVIIVGIGITALALAGIYKFNYLANQPGYTVDGNKMTKGDAVIEKEIEDTMTISIANSELDGTVTFTEYTVEKTSGVLDATLEKLFEVKSGNNGLYNGFTYDDVILDNGVARIFLDGSFFAAGDLSGAYMQADVRNTIFQFDTITAFEVYVNDRLFDWCVDDASGGEGPCPEIPQLWTESR